MTLYIIKMPMLSFEELNNKFGIDNKAMSNIRIEDIGKDINLTPKELVMRDQKPDNTSERWFLVIRRECGPIFYFDSFGVETPPFS